MAESNSFNTSKLVAGALGILLLLSAVLINSLNSDISDNESLIKSQEGEIKVDKDQIVQLGVDHSTEITILQENHTAAITELEEENNNLISDIANLTEENEKLKTPSYQPRFSNHLKASLENWIEDSDSVNSTYGDINTWDTSLITNMSELFYNEGTFNGNISDWDVSSVTNMQYMFYYATSFNQSISDWDVSSVTDMDWMFAYTDSFNQNLSEWDVSSVTDMEYMFYDAESFNGNISDWDVSSVTNMQYMFDSATSFNQDLSDWDVSSVTDMTWMFASADSLSGDNKCYIHTSFSSNENWPYNWDEYCD